MSGTERRLVIIADKRQHIGTDMENFSTVVCEDSVYLTEWLVNGTLHFIDIFGCVDPRKHLLNVLTYLCM